MENESTVRWYDRKGNLLKDYTEIEKLLSTKDYKIVKQELTDNERYWVSTVWLGLNHNFTAGTPIIFETMVFDENSETQGENMDVERYSTEEEAIEGHKRMFEKWNSK